MQAVVPTVDHNPTGYTAAEILAGIAGVTGTRRWSFRYELLDSTNTKVADLGNVEHGSVAQNWLADIKRTATFHFEEEDYIDYLSDRVKPWVRLHLPPFGADNWVEWPQGVFMLSTPSRSVTEAGHVHRDVEGYDLLQVLADDKVADRYHVAAGTAYTTAVLALLPAGAAYNVESSTKTLAAAAEWDPGTTKLAIVNELLGGLNYQSLSVDEDGTYIARAYQPPSERTDEYTYADDSNGLVIPKVDQTLDLWSIANHWVRTVSEPDRSVITSTLTNTDPASLTSTVRRQRTITDFATVQDAADQATLDSIVARVAFEASQVYEAIDFSSGLNPLHSGNDVYRITYGPLGLDASYSEHRWEMDLQAGAPMTHRARRVVSLAV
jgi:hypothetical protein